MRDSLRPPPSPPPPPPPGGGTPPGGFWGERGGGGGEARQLKLARLRLARQLSFDGESLSPLISEAWSRAARLRCMCKRTFGGAEGSFSRR